MLGIAGFWTLLLRVDLRLIDSFRPSSAPELFGVQLLDQTFVGTALFLSGPVLNFVTGFIAVRTARPSDGAAGVPASPRLRKLYGGFMFLGPAVIFCGFLLMNPLAIGWQLLAVYLLFRYALGERFVHEPILFLRSFRSTEAADAFGRILTRTASGYGVVVGLVHATQRSSDLHRLARVTDHGKFHLVSDDQWQGWVLAHLKRCSAVIIDVSVETGSVIWELANARRIAGPDKLLVLRQEGASATIPSGCQIVLYKGNGGVADTEKSLVFDWLTQRFDGVRPGQVLVTLGACALLAAIILCIVLGIRAATREEKPRQSLNLFQGPALSPRLPPIDIPESLPRDVENFLREQREWSQKEWEKDQARREWFNQKEGSERESARLPRSWEKDKAQMEQSKQVKRVMKSQDGT
jgi:hypothetical protein